MSFDLRSFRKKVKSSSSQVFFLYGEEEYLAQLALKEIEKTYVDSASRDFNYDVFYGKERPVSALVDIVETLPMMSQKRLIVAKQVDKWGEPEWELLYPYLENPMETTVLVFLAQKLDKRKKSAKRLAKTATMIEFKKLYDNQVVPWIDFIVQTHNMTIERSAVPLLHQLVGSNLLDIDNEVKKLKQFIGERDQIQVKDVIEVVSKIKVQSVFDLSRAIGENDRARALLCLSQLLSHGQNEVGILSLVSRHVRILRSVKSGKKAGLFGPQLASQVGVSPYFLKEYESQSVNWSDAKIERTFKVLVDTDRALKSSPISSHIWLENFVIQTCS